MLCYIICVVLPNCQLILDTIKKNFFCINKMHDNCDSKINILYNVVIYCSIIDLISGTNKLI